MAAEGNPKIKRDLGVQSNSGANHKDWAISKCKTSSIVFEAWSNARARRIRRLPANYSDRIKKCRKTWIEIASFASLRGDHGVANLINRTSKKNSQPIKQKFSEEHDQFSSLSLSKLNQRKYWKVIFSFFFFNCRFVRESIFFLFVFLVHFSFFKF